MRIDAQKTYIGDVPVRLDRSGDFELSVRGIVSSRLQSAEIVYGPAARGGKAVFPDHGDAYCIGVIFENQRSDIVVAGTRFAHLRRKSETQILYVSAVEEANFDAPRHDIEILMRQSFLREIAEDLELPHVTHLGQSLCHVTEDPTLRNLALKIHPFFDEPETLDPLQADHFMWALGLYVCAAYGDLAARRPMTGGLTSWQERLAKEVIETSLIGGIGLAELAALCRLRTSQFAHAFKRSTGMAPYQWLLQRRIARAKDQILSAPRETSLAEIALACGFADQSHLTRIFARAVGTTPAAWRQCIRSSA